MTSTTVDPEVREPDTSGTFDEFAKPMRAWFKEMSEATEGRLFVVDADRDAIWQRYLDSFPPGTNPLFRERTEHDCSCCRHFIRRVGPVVGVVNGRLSTVWDLQNLPPKYQAVADSMASYIRSLPIRDLFLSDESSVGTPVSHEHGPMGSVLTWHHFSVDVDRRSRVRRHDLDRRLGDYRTSRQMLERAVTELTVEAVDTVLELAESRTLYRGEEHVARLREFKRLQDQALGTATDPREMELFFWTNAQNPAARIRNSSIGTLLVDLSSGMDTEEAVRRYEAVVAPHNYRRPKAIVTKKQVEDALATIRRAGVEESLERRHARLEDISIRDVLFVDRSAKPKLRDSVADILTEAVAKPALDSKRARAIPVDKFVEEVLPDVTRMELQLENAHRGNLVSLTAPVHPEAPSLFRWDSGVAWSYSGNVADSVKERVKRAGGQVEDVAMRFSLAWQNTDDLDIHVHGPGGHIWFGGKRGACGGELDVDMNVVSPVRDAVENVRWRRSPRDGEYRITVHNYTHRERVDVGFEVEVEAGGRVESFHYREEVRGHQTVDVATVQVKRGVVTEITPEEWMVPGSSSHEVWGLRTGEPVPVESVLLSPNYWDETDGSGNRHLFFVLWGCANPDPVRGVYNEFLRPDLAKHRRAFELLGERTKIQPVPAEEQLSGVGFSSTKRAGVLVATDVGTYRVEF